MLCRYKGRSQSGFSTQVLPTPPAISGSVYFYGKHQFKIAEVPSWRWAALSAAHQAMFIHCSPLSPVCVSRRQSEKGVRIAKKLLSSFVLVIFAQPFFFVPQRCPHQKGLWASYALVYGSSGESGCGPVWTSAPCFARVALDWAASARRMFGVVSKEAHWWDWRSLERWGLLLGSDQSQPLDSCLLLYEEQKAIAAACKTSLSTVVRIHFWIPKFVMGCCPSSASMTLDWP